MKFEGKKSISMINGRKIEFDLVVMSVLGYVFFGVFSMVTLCLRVCVSEKLSKH